MHGQALNLMGATHPAARNLVGNWNSIVGYQNSGQPTHLQHGMYGGHRARGWHPNFGGYGGPGFGMRHGGHWAGTPWGGWGYGAELDPYGYGAAPSWPAPVAPAPFYGGYAPAPYAIPPRNQLVEQPGPTQANRIILPLSSGSNVLPNTSVQVTSRSQTYAFRGERIVISGSESWIVNDVKIGNRSQLAQSGDLPGVLFSNLSVDCFISFETCQCAMDFVVVATNVGSSESGEQFVAAVLGTAAI